MALRFARLRNPHQEPPVTPNDALNELTALKDQALDQANQIGRQIDAGTPSDKLVPLLQSQVETLTQFQMRLSDFVKSDPGEVHREAVQQLKIAVQNLSQTANRHVQRASKKGVRLSGIGGKPHMPNRKRNAP